MRVLSGAIGLGEAIPGIIFELTRHTARLWLTPSMGGVAILWYEAERRAELSMTDDSDRRQP